MASNPSVLARSSMLISLVIALIAVSTIGAGGTLASDPPASTAGDVDNPAILHFRVLDENDGLIPARLTFIGPAGPGAELFPNADAAPMHLAVRSNVIYTADGEDTVTVPPGRYTIYASRGLEWSADSKELDLRAGQRSDFVARLHHEVDTRGWISGDFHLHTLTYSGHGDSNLKERIITFVGEGLEFAVATDHNHHTDYDPIVRDLELQDHMTTVTGNEVSVPVGHFNAFPLDPGRPVPPKDAHDARKLFQILRAEPNQYGIVPVIQVNHPRWGRIDYFGRTHVDPVTGTTDDAFYSDDFDTIEIFNDNPGWGYYEAEIVRNLHTGSTKHSVLHDWFNLLNRGQRYAAVGNSDSHTVYRAYAGYPRNFVPSKTDDPAQIRVPEVARALRSKQVFTTLGPFVEYTANGEPMGSDIRTRDGQIELSIRIQAASWVDCDRAKVVVNGDVVDVLPVPDTRNPVRLDTTYALQVKQDSWVTLLVEGDDPLAPIVHDAHEQRPILPLAVMNPVWVDGDGDGQWTSPWQQALQRVERQGGSSLAAFYKAVSLPSQRALILLAAVTKTHEAAPEIVRQGLSDDQRPVLLAAARGAEALADSTLGEDLERTFRNQHEDPYLRVAILRALGACAQLDARNLALKFVADHPEKSERYEEELLPLLPGAFVRDWRVVGYFDKNKQGGYGPEQAERAAGPFVGKGSRPISWTTMHANEQGYLDLRAVDPRESYYTNAIAFCRTFLYSPHAREIVYTLGTDDGCMLWLNGKVWFTDFSRRAARPFQKVGKLSLQEGWNEVLLMVENGNGGFGAYFRVLDDEVQMADKAVKSE